MKTLWDFLTDQINKYGQGTFADRIGIDASVLSKFRSGEGAMKLEPLEKAIEEGGAVIAPQAYLMKLEDTIDTLSDLWKAERKKRYEDLELIEPIK